MLSSSCLVMFLQTLKCCQRKELPALLLLATSLTLSPSGAAWKMYNQSFEPFLLNVIKHFCSFPDIFFNLYWRTALSGKSGVLFIPKQLFHPLQMPSSAFSRILKIAYLWVSFSYWQCPCQLIRYYSVRYCSLWNGLQ